MTTLQVPNFRVPKRLIAWMQDNGVRERLPSAEKVFFKENIDLGVRAWGLVGYSKLVGKLTDEMEEIISKSPNACVGYAGSINRSDVPDKVIDACGENATVLTKMAGMIGRRIYHLESAIRTPDEYMNYAVETHSRIPEIEERTLFSEDFTPIQRSDAARELVSRLEPHYYGNFREGSPARDQRIRDLIKLCPESVIKFMNYLYGRGLRLEPDFYWSFAGDGPKLAKLAEHIRKRLPEDLEATWKGGASELVQYARRWVRTRLPEHLESVLIGDHKCAAQYAFEVVRGFADPKLPDNLHAFMLMKSFEIPEDQDIKRYVEECKRIAELNE